MMGIPLFPLNGPIFQVIHCPRKDDKLWQILSGLSDDAKVICFANTKRRVNKRANGTCGGACGQFGPMTAGSLPGWNCLTACFFTIGL